MLKIVSSPADTKGFDVDQFYRVYRVAKDVDWSLAAICSSSEEAHDAQEMLCDLTAGQYHISPPRSKTN